MILACPTCRSVTIVTGHPASRLICPKWDCTAVPRLITSEAEATALVRAALLAHDRDPGRLVHSDLDPASR